MSLLLGYLEFSHRTRSSEDWSSSSVISCRSSLLPFIPEEMPRRQPHSPSPTWLFDFCVYIVVRTTGWRKGQGRVYSSISTDLLESHMTFLFISYWPEHTHVDADSCKRGSEMCPDKHQDSVTKSKGSQAVTFATGNRTVRAADGYYSKISRIWPISHFQLCLSPLILLNKTRHHSLCPSLFIPLPLLLLESQPPPSIFIQLHGHFSCHSFLNPLPLLKTHSTDLYFYLLTRGNKYYHTYGNTYVLFNY